MKRMNNHDVFMRRAIELSRIGGIERKCGGPFGAVIVKDNKIIAEGYNRVVETSDPTAHAEIVALREASQKLNTPHLEGCILYTSAECCPMCLSAAYWAHIQRIYFASTIEDAENWGRFQDLEFYEELKKEATARKIPCEMHLREEAVVVWKKYALMENKVHY